MSRITSCFLTSWEHPGHLAVQEVGQQLPALSAPTLQFAFAASHRFSADLRAAQWQYFQRVLLSSQWQYVQSMVVHQVRVWQVADASSSLLSDLQHEEVLDSPGFEEDKALILQVFRTREAWHPKMSQVANTLGAMSLDALSREAQQELRKGNFTAVSAQRWRQTGEAALKRAIVAIERRASLLPHGPELWEWYQSVLWTVNSEEDTSLERLIGHGERLDRMRHRRRLLQEGEPVLSCAKHWVVVGR
eukprot:Skav215227  [mRNA]  locus=scaffold341:278108:283897:- [translate_table: standard]